MKHPEIVAFQAKILSWYAEHKRDLPWRHPSLKLRNGSGRDPYKILVSEVMLQQTQVSRVIPKYEAWLQKFPTIESLAHASTAEVLRLWSGLGYNRRAVYLQKAAQTIVRDYQGIWPKEQKALGQLPGIGAYTSRAILCFAFNQQLAIVDTNIRKVILTQFGRTMSEREVQRIADALLPKGEVLRLRSGRSIQATAYEWNQALMDYASSVLKNEKIPIVKQSRFHGSNRYYRGQIIRLLTTTSMMQENELQRELHIDEEKLRTILGGLIRDGLVKQKNTTFFLPT